jgi:hypothetical protein
MFAPLNFQATQNESTAFFFRLNAKAMTFVIQCRCHGRAASAERQDTAISE